MAKIRKAKPKTKTRKIYSIRIQFALIFMALLAGTMLISLAVNGLFLNSVYQFQKMNVLENAYEVIAEAYSNDLLEDDSFTKEMEELAAKNSLSVIVMDASGTSVYSSGGEGDMLIEQFRFVLFGDKDRAEVILDRDAYVIERAEDMSTSGKYLVLMGNLDDSTMVMMRIALASIEDSTNISMQFTVFVSFFAMILGAVVIFFVTRVITDPILNLTTISKKMTELDFDVKYDGNLNNEIGELGQHMNELSTTLEQTISELKTANNEMKLDLDRKEQIDQMRTDFLSNVSHELKTPLALIQGDAEGLRDCVLDDAESREFYCDVIIDEAEKMNIMVRKLLTLNQLEFGANEISMERFNLLELIQGVISSMSIMLEQEDITVEFNETEPIVVWADEFKVEEVLTNYMSNAIHHIGGERIIRIGVERKENNVRISVFNTGNPIPQEDLERLWEKFYKVDKSHSRQYGGSGIGLSIVKAIMDAFHQDFGVQNHEDGVEFWFELDNHSI